MGRGLMDGGGVSPAKEEVPVTSMGNVAAVTTTTTTTTTTSLPPGFRFNPSDKELVSYYLKRKVLNEPCFDAIGEIDIYKHEPWDLSEYSKLKTRDQEWYFYSALDKKYATTGTRMSRGTNEGYWKTTGKDREIRGGGGGGDDQLMTIGMKKTLVFHTGRPPYGLPTDWMIYEYRLVDHEPDNNNQVPQREVYVLCKLFCKEEFGPSSSGNRYASLLEQGWDKWDGKVRDMAEYFGSNEIQQQENQKQRKYLIDINELPREFEIDENSEHDESLNREYVAEELPPCVLNTEAPLPLIQYKRKRQNNNDSSGTNCSSTTTTDDTTNITFSAPAETNTAISGMLENEAEPVATMVSPTKLIKELKKEKHSISVKRPNLEHDIMKADITIDVLQIRIDMLNEENKGQ